MQAVWYRCHMAKGQSNISGAIGRSIEAAKSIGANSTPQPKGFRGSAAYEATSTDFGPWIETPNSTRVSKYRYDYLNDTMQVMWKNNKKARTGHSSPTDVSGTVYGAGFARQGERIYHDPQAWARPSVAPTGSGQTAISPVTYETFRQFARSVSKGKSVNNLLNGMGYKGMSMDEYSAPSNPRYRAPSRTRDSK